MNENLDVLKKLEDLSNKINQVMEENTKSVFQKYPVTFALLVLFGADALSGGVKGILEEIHLSVHPWFMLFIGIIILLVTGRLYKKLDK